MKQFPVFRPQRASIRRKAFSESLRTQLFEVCVCFPERGRPLFASGSANSFEMEKEIKAIIEFSHQEKGKDVLVWGTETRNEIWAEEQLSLCHPNSLFFGSIQPTVVTCQRTSRTGESRSRPIKSGLAFWEGSVGWDKGRVVSSQGNTGSSWSVVLHGFKRHIKQALWWVLEVSIVRWDVD